MDLVSVIIPIYNAEKMIGRCLKSVQDQTYSNLEIILINDGSTDNTDQVISRFIEGDKRISYQIQKNQGVSSARNRGISLATGKYIVFCDSDDYIHKEYIEKMVKSKEKYYSDWVVAGYESISREGRQHYERPYDTEFIPENGMEEFLKCWIYLNMYIAGPCSKLYDASIIHENDIRFLVDMDYGEDTVFNILYISYCKTVSIVFEALYFVSENLNSLTHKNRPDIWSILMQVYEAFYHLVVEKGYNKELYQLFFYREELVAFSCAMANSWEWNQWKELCEEIKNSNYYLEFSKEETKRLDRLSFVKLKLFNENRFVMLWILLRLQRFVKTHFKKIYHFFKRLNDNVL